MKKNKTTYLLAVLIYTLLLVGCNQENIIDYYHVQWLDYDGIVLETGIYEKEQNPIYHGEIPIHPYNGYIFVGWDQEIEPIQGDVIYTAVYSENIYELVLDEETNTYIISGLIWSNLHDYQITQLIIPANYEGIPITVIGKNAFEELTIKIEEVIVSEGIISIEEKAFFAASLSKIKLPDTLEYIGDRAFGYCAELKEFIMPNSVTNLGEFILTECWSLERVVLSNKISTIPKGMFIGSGLSELQIPQSVTKIENGGISGTNLRYLVIPENVKVIEQYGITFNESLLIVEIQSEEIEFGAESLAYNINLRTVIFKEGITNFSSGMFTGCWNLQNINIPKSVVSIGNNAFKDCRNLERLFIPDNILYIGEGVFHGCLKLTIYAEVNEKPEIWPDDWSEHNESDPEITVVWGVN